TDTSAIHNLVNDTNDLVNAKGNLFESKLKVSTYDKIIAHESVSTDEDPIASPTESARKRKHSEEEYGLKTPPLRSPNKDALIHTPNKRQMYNDEVIRYLDAMGQSLKYNKVHVQTPPMWTKIESYLENALKKSGENFKEAIMLKIEGDDENKLRLYCEKILMDFYNLVDVFPTLSRKIGERKYIVQNLSSLFKFYETTFGNITIDWIESHSLSAKLTKSPTSSGIVKLDAKGVRSFDDKEIWHMEVAGSPSSPTTDHAVGDTKKSLHSDILNLVALLLDHLDIPVKTAMNIKVFSLQAIGYRITLYSLNVTNDGSFLASELASAIIPFSFE
ncbi:1552_t:CDS:2, partial [Ambispora gerdemannii]